MQRQPRLFFFFSSVGANNGRKGRMILQFNINLTTPSCFPAAWSIIHGKARWKPIDWENELDFSCMFAIHPGRVVVFALQWLCFHVWCVSAFVTGPQGTYPLCLVIQCSEVQSCGRSTAAPSVQMEMSLSSKFVCLFCLFALTASVRCWLILVLFLHGFSLRDLYWLSRILKICAAVC